MPLTQRCIRFAIMLFGFAAQRFDLCFKSFLVGKCIIKPAAQTGDITGDIWVTAGTCSAPRLVAGSNAAHTGTQEYIDLAE